MASAAGKLYTQLACQLQGGGTRITVQAGTDFAKLSETATDQVRLYCMSWFTPRPKPRVPQNDSPLGQGQVAGLGSCQG